MSTLDKLRRARESKVTVGGFSFTIRRPTDMEMVQNQGQFSADKVIDFIVGWDGVKELDIIPGGDPHPLEFDAALCREWLADRLDLFAPLMQAVVDSYAQHVDKLGAAEKK